jgi:hypothetical protein
VPSHGEREDVHLKSIAVIPLIIEKSIFITEEGNAKENDKYDRYRYYVAGMKIGGEDYTVRMVAGKRGGDWYYDHELTRIEKSSLIDITRSTNSLGINKAKSQYKDKRLFSILQSNFSGELDKNGEPVGDQVPAPGDLHPLDMMFSMSFSNPSPGIQDLAVTPLGGEGTITPGDFERLARDLVERGQKRKERRDTVAEFNAMMETSKMFLERDGEGKYRDEGKGKDGGCG